MIKRKQLAVALLCGSFGVAGAAFAQGTISVPKSATGANSSSAGTSSSGVGASSGTVAGQDNVRGNVGSAPNSAVGSDHSAVSNSGNPQSQGNQANQNYQSNSATQNTGNYGTSSNYGGASNNAGSSRSASGDSDNYSRTSQVAADQKVFDPAALNLGKTATPQKSLNRGNRARVEANERRITAELNRAAAKATESNPG